jgi:hypothetical protein
LVYPSIWRRRNQEAYRGMLYTWIKLSQWNYFVWLMYVNSKIKLKK